MKFGLRWVGLVLLCMSLSACISDVLTGANVIYDRHHWYQKINDLQIMSRTKQMLFVDKRLKCRACSIEITVFKKDVLLVGYVPTQTLRRLADERMKNVYGKRHFYNELSLTSEHESTDSLMDSWITAKIRSEILADSSIDPSQFKVVTEDRVVYLMGDVLADQADKVVMFAREWSEVKRVVKLFQYYQLSSHNSTTENTHSSSGLSNLEQIQSGDN